MATPPKQTRVLLIDDDEEDYLIVRSLFAKIPHTPFMLDWVGTFEDGAASISAANHDVYLIDYRLGMHNGLELLKDIDLQSVETPFIILTGAGDEEIERKAMRTGVADYLVKGSFDADLLSRVIRYSLQRKHMEAQRIQHLVEVNDSKDEFIALASHELRTPASAVKQYLGMLMDGYAGEVPTEQMPFLKTAFESNERQIKIINDILLVAQLDLRKLTMHKEPLDVAKMMHGILKDVPRLTDRESPATYDNPRAAIRVNADPNYLRMALTNIAENAAKYTPSDRPIAIRIAREDDRKVEIIVQDEGVGIARQDIDKLFKKFSRIQNPLSVEVGGTGLGLYWADQIIKLHGGFIKVVSAPGKGSTFTVVLPMWQPNA
jgi:two-component system sensor histidine kinase/response regulator